MIVLLPILFLSLFAGSLLLTIAAFIFRKTALARWRWYCFATFVVLCGVYLWSLAVVWRDPYWVDPCTCMSRPCTCEANEFIPVPYRFSWALISAGLLEIPVLFFFFFGAAVLHDRLARRAAKLSSSSESVEKVVPNE
jgi:hypothetical protein